MTLEFTLNQQATTGVETGCVVVGVFAGKQLSPAAQAIDAASGGRLTRLIERGDITGKPGQTALLHDLDGVAAPRVLVVGLGEADKFATPQYLKAVADAVRGAARASATPVTRIGRMQAGAGVSVRLAGAPWAPQGAGWDHFAAAP